MIISDVLKNTEVDKTEAEIILADIIGKDRSFLFTHPEYNLSPSLSKKLLDRLNRRFKSEPLAYILGYKEFYGLKFFVDQRVLIPRSETEELIDPVLNHIRSIRSKSVKIADIGTGSGCIAITLAKHLLNAKIHAVDIDENALAVAKKNAKLHSVDSKITFLKGDLLSPLPEPVDIVVANLPYIKTNDLKTLKREISEWEPRVALDGGKDGMELYQKLFDQAEKSLNAGGSIFYELDGKVYTFYPD